MAKDPLQKTMLDPICGLCLEPEQIAATYTYIGEEYGFCSQECYEMFRRAPEYYVALVAHDKRGHCGQRTPTS